MDARVHISNHKLNVMRILLTCDFIWFSYIPFNTKQVVEDVGCEIRSLNEIDV